MEANTRIQELREIVAQHDHEYYVLGAATISDAAYDGLYQELQVLERQYPELIDEHSPTQRVGGVGTSGFVKVKHARKMLSLDNLRTAKEVIKAFEPGEQVLIEPKIDGLSLKLVYKDGKLVQAVTRGNGNEGDDVTANARAIRTVPLVLSEKVSIEVLGEIYMTYDAFNALNAALEAEEEEPMANARNAAAGTLKLKDPKIVAQRHLSFVAYGLHTEVAGLKLQYELTEWLYALGFCNTWMLPTAEKAKCVTCEVVLESEQQVEALLNELNDRRKLLNLQTDGLVFKVNALNKQQDFGEGNKYPNWAYAFKYPPERRATTLLDVTIQIGKTGKVTPVAELKPVLLSGTTVQRASLCNQEEIARLNVNIGDEIFVEKAAEIIPNVVGVAQKRKEGHYKIPVHCPVCKSKLVQPEGFVDTFCMNPLCEEQVYNKLRYALSKDALDLHGCGKAMVRELMRHKACRLSDVFLAHDKSFDFLKPAARKNFLEQRELAKTRPFWRQMAALCIEGLGVTLCQELEARYSSLERVMDNWSAISGIVGKSVHASMALWFKLEANAQEVDRLQDAGFTFASDGVGQGPLSGQVFVITGTLLSGQRAEVEERIRKAGGVTKSSVTRKCNFVVQGVGGGRKKAEAVEKLGVLVISEEKLYEMLGVPMPAVEMPNLEALRDE